VVTQTSLTKAVEIGRKLILGKNLGLHACEILRDVTGNVGLGRETGGAVLQGIPISHFGRERVVILFEPRKQELYGSHAR
jgi:hypothetical protein